MSVRKILLTGLKILAVCLLFAVCFAVGGALSGIDKIGQRTVASQPAPPANQQVPQMPENLLRGFLIFILCVGGTLSYIILRARWHGWMLVAAIFVSMYGISTVASQLDSIVFLSDKLPQGMIRAIFVQGAIAAALFAPLAVLALGRWRAGSLRAPMSSAAPLKLASIMLRLATLVVAFVFLYMFFGYYVAWRNPELRHFYGGPELATFWAAWRHNWTSSPLDLRRCRVPRSRLHRVSVPARSHAPHFAAGVGLGCGALLGLLDNRLAVAESVDARQCRPQPFLGDAVLQLALRCPRRLASVLYCPRQPSSQLKNRS